MKFTFLSAAMPLTKSYTKLPDGTITKSSYPHAYEFTTHVEEITSLQQLEAQLIKHADLGHCLLKGNTSKPLVSESRAGSTSTQDPTNWLCFDIDGLDISTVEDFMTHIGLPDVSYIIQWSASYLVNDKKLRCHIFVFMHQSVSAPLVKQWLMSLNHSVAPLRNGMSLTKTGNSLSWPLDITACQNDKLLYIAPPVFKAMKSPLGTGAKAQPRIELVKKKTDLFNFPSTVNAGKNQDLTDKRIHELRAEQGMPKRKLQYKVTNGNTIMVKPDSCDATEIRQERGFVYFNINGGDSWGYYHPEDNPQFIYNFKGEPTYLTSELLPDYWKSLQMAGSRETSTGQTHLAFCDRSSGIYYKGTYDKTNDLLDLTPAKTLIILDHYMKQNGMIMGDYVPEWEMTFDPESTLTVDTANRRLNTFQLTEYMKKEPKNVDKCPPTIFKFIHHACGSDIAITEHFINWLAFILQNRDRTLTSWVLHGTQGCLAGDTVLEFNRGARNGGRPLTVAEAYTKWTGRFKRGPGKGKAWDMSISTRTKSVRDGMTVGYHDVFNIVESGKKQLYRLTTNTGRTIRVTELHPFMRPDGSFTELKDLKPRDSVVVEGRPLQHVAKPKGRNKQRHTTHSIPYHLYAWEHWINGKNYQRCHTARLVVEADMNGLSLNEYIGILRNDQARACRLKYLSYDVIVHHRDENPSNDALDNLAVISKDDHDKHHAKEVGLGTISTAIETIKSIKKDKIEMTYDLVMKAPYHNYIANGFAVHNTGKGVVVDKILRPIFGFNQTTVRRMEEFKQPYNAYMRQCFIVVVDEVQTRSLVDESGVMANIKNFVTEPMITIRQMYASPVECRNYTNWIFCSNKVDPIQIDREDRRTNVAKYQPEKFYKTEDDLKRWPADKAKIEKELQAFHDYLFSFKVDQTAAATPIQTEDRDALISIGENAIDTVSSALLDGDMDFLLEQLPTSSRPKTRTDDINRLEDYRHTLKDILMRTDALTGRVNIARDELRAIYEYSIGKIPESPNKFTALLKHHRIMTKKVWVNDRAVYGISATFKDVADFGKYLKLVSPQSKLTS